MSDPTITGSVNTSSINDNGGGQTIFSGLTVNDADGGNTFAVRISLTDPGLGAISGTAFTWTKIDSFTYQLTGLTLAQANAALDEAKFTPVNNFSPSGTASLEFQVTVSDNPGGAGGAAFIRHTIDIVRIDDAPTVNGSQGFNRPINSTETFMISPLNLGYTDVDSGPQWGGLTVTALPSHGTLFRDANHNLAMDPGEEVTPGQFLDLSSGNLLGYKPDANYGGAEAFTYIVRDPQGLDALTATTINFQVRSVPQIAGTIDTAPIIDGESRLIFSGLDVTDYDVGENDFSAWIRVIEGGQGRITSSNALYRWNARGAPDQGFYYLEKLVGGVFVTTGITVSDINDALDFANFTAADDGQWDLDDSVRFEVTVDDSPVTVTADTATIHGVRYSSGELNIIPENDAPVNTVPGAQDMAQGATIVFNNANNNAISVTDVDYGTGPNPSPTLTVTITAPDGILTVTPDISLDSITGNGTNTIVITGNDYELNQTLQGLTYKPPAGFTGTRIISITTDDGGEYPPPAQHTTSGITVRVGTVNGTPDITDLQNDTNYFTEDGPPVPFDVDTAAVVTDDNANFGAGTLTVVFTNLANTVSHAADQIVVVSDSDVFVRSRLTGPSTSVLEVVVGEVVIGTVTSNGLNGAPLTITFNGNATVARVEQLVRVVGFNNPSDTPTEGNREVQLTLVDGSGPNAKSVVVNSATIWVIAQNGVPVLTSHTTPISYTEAGAPVALMSGVTMTDEESSLGFANGRVRITVSGGGATPGSVMLKAGSDFVVVGNELRLNEGANQYVIGQISGYGTSGVLVSGMTANATQARLNNLFDDFVFSTTGASTRVSGTYAVTLQFNDGSNGGTTPTAPNIDVTQSLVYTAVNSAPLLDLDTGAPGTGVAVAYVENAGPTVITTSPSFSDPESNIKGGSLTVQIASATADDRLTIINDDVIQTVGNKIYYYELGIVGTFTGGIGGAPLVIALGTSEAFFTINEMLADLLTHIGYSNVSDAPGASRQITFTLDDGDGGPTSSASAIAAVTITQDNDPPSAVDTNSASLLDTQTHVFTVADFATGMTDPEGNGLGGVQIVTLPAGSEGVIVYDADGSGSASSPVPIAPDDTFTRNDLELGRLSFVPTPSASAVPITITFKVSDDGTPSAKDDSANVFTLNVGHANQPPVVDLDAGASGNGFASSYTEGAAGAAVSDADVTITDADAGDDIVKATITITNAVAGDVLTLGAHPATITSDPSSTNTTLKLVAAAGTSAADFQTAIAAVTFSSTSGDPTAHGANLARSITIVVNDGISNSNIATATVDVTDVNNAPTGTDKTISATEDVFRVLTATDFGFNDVDGTIGSVTVSAISGGTLYYDADGTAGGGAPVAIAPGAFPYTFSGQDLADGKALYRAAPDANGAALGSITFTVTDNDGADAAGPNTMTIDVAAVDDPAVAVPDAVSTNENQVLSGDVFAANPTTKDSDVDGPPIQVGAVNGVPGDVGQTITLSSGAKLKLNSDGTFSYNPNGAFNYLTHTGNAGEETGAADTAATDTFKYTLVNGNETTVTVTVNGVASADDLLYGTSGNDVIVGTEGGDFFRLEQGGNDTATGLGGGDAFYFGNTLTANDHVDGGDGRDVVAIQGGAYAGGYTLGADNLVNVETLSILTGSDTRFGDPGTNLYDYNIITTNANVANGAQLIVNASSLLVGEDLTFNGSAETDGTFFIYGGNGTDKLTGGSGADVFFFADGRWGASDQVNGGSGNDIVVLRGPNGTTDITFGATQLNSVETVTLMSAADTRFYSGGARYDYKITTNNGNVLSGATMTFNAGGLQSDETFTFNGTAETDGHFRVFGGGGMDFIQGGHGDDLIFGGGYGDTLYGGGGNDTFRYQATTDSNGLGNGQDGIQDFNLGDLIDLSRIDANIQLAGDQAFTIIGNAAFQNAGDLRVFDQGGGIWVVQGDVDGDHQADFSLSVVVTDNNVHPLTGADFLL
jgi:Ca2+-binding RTX toxin-like protein